MGCVISANFSILINGSPTEFFKSKRGIRQGCPLSPLLFLLVIEELRRQIKKASLDGSFKGLKVTRGLCLTHLMFVDDVLIMGTDSEQDWKNFKNMLEAFYKVTRLEVNFLKLTFLFNNIESQRRSLYEDLFGMSLSHIDIGLKYLGSQLKPNDYRTADWRWLIQKMEKKLCNWTS